MIPPQSSSKEIAEIYEKCAEKLESNKANASNFYKLVYYFSIWNVCIAFKELDSSGKIN